MTYFQFLGIFIGVPLVTLVLVQRKRLTLSEGSSLVVLSVVAVAYTTLWDNYLVANRIWWYDPGLVAGVTLGWVPLEEYLFFILETLLVGLWFIFLWKASPHRSGDLAGSLRWILPLGLTMLWAGMAIILVNRWDPGRYLALELVWALPPIMLQLAFGADLIWRARRLVGAAIITATVYLSAADWVAIRSGIWTISPRYTLGLDLGGLPFEEIMFFMLTSILIVFGVFLSLAPASQERIRDFLGRRIQQRPRARTM